MPGNSSLKLILILSFLIFLSGCGAGQLPYQSLRIMFYNTENFFDTKDDTLTDDNEFLPAGSMRWNSTRYNRKLNSLYKTIIAAGDWEPPSVIAFCEIENRKVLEDIIYGTYLSKFRYKIIHEESPDRRGIDVCLIYRDNIVSISSYKYWSPEIANYSSRNILYVKLLVGDDTIHLIVNHWPSRRGGVLAGQDNRQIIGAMVREKVDSLFSRNEFSKILILGDFNSSPEDQVIQTLTTSPDINRTLVNLSASLESKGVGTYRYMGSWEMIDQVIISKNLLCKSGIYTTPEMLTIFKPDFLMKKDSKYPGLSPFPTYKGFRYQGGFSDHLPVFLDLRIMPQQVSAPIQLLFRASVSLLLHVH